MPYSDKPIKMKTNQDGGSYTAKNPAAAAKQLKENQLMKKGKKLLKKNLNFYFYFL